MGFDIIEINLVFFIFAQNPIYYSDTGTTNNKTNPESQLLGQG